ncbi:MAG: peptide ABC transporter substrate-binding protein [Anaerolineales bacterium]|nr:peptide ABC transporter substrate-binding protein [Anaerolineales bacterium]GJQ36466.1 MAG: ABC transporter substrate-binding protein [Anaerolineaceae bacterium]
MLRNRLFALLGLLVIASMALAACGAPAAPEEGPAATEAAPEATEAAPAEPKVMVACLAQEPSTLYMYSESALVKSFVLDAIYDGYAGPLGGYDARTYDYQSVYYNLSTFDDTAEQNTIEVGVGDVVYDPAQDAAVELAAGMTISMNQAEGDPVEVTVEEGQKYPIVQIVTAFTLADGMTWEDGTPVTTADVQFSYDVGASPDTPSVKYFYTTQTQKIEIVDDSTYKYYFMPGYTSGTYFVDGMIHPLPAHVYGEGGSNPLTPAEMLADESVNRAPLAFGPFKMVEWVAGDHLTVEKNPTYWRAGEGLPKLDTLIYRFIPDTNQLIAQLASGECDFGTQDAAFEGSLPLIRQFEAEGLMVPQVVAGTVFEHLDFNTKPVESYTGAAATLKASDGSLLFQNVDFRHAIAYCIDRQAVVDAATNGAAVVQHTYTASDHPLYAGDDNITVYEFDPEKGKELLAGLGWTDSDGDGILDSGGQKLSFIHSTRVNPLREKVTQIVQAQLKDNCGIETKIELIGSEYFADGPDGLVFGRQYDLGEFAWLTGVEPPCTLYISSQVPSAELGWGNSNNTGFENADFDAACNAATQALDEATKAAEHAKAQAVFTEYLPSLPLFARAKILVTRPNVVGVLMDPTANSEFWNVENFDFEN